MKNLKNRAQVSLEVTVAFICIMVLLFASVRIFVWMNQRMVQRQKDYEDTRIAAGSIEAGESGVYVDYSDEEKYPKMDILGENTER